MLSEVSPIRPHFAAANEATPLIKPGVKPDVRRTASDVLTTEELLKNRDTGMGSMIELGLPLMM